MRHARSSVHALFALARDVDAAATSRVRPSAAAASVRAGVVLSEPVQHFLKRPLTKTQKAMYAAAGLTGPDPCIE